LAAPACAPAPQLPSHPLHNSQAPMGTVVQALTSGLGNAPPPLGMGLGMGAAPVPLGLGNATQAAPPGLASAQAPPGLCNPPAHPGLGPSQGSAASPAHRLDNLSLAFGAPEPPKFDAATNNGSAAGTLDQGRGVCEPEEDDIDNSDFAKLPSFFGAMGETGDDDALE